MTGVEIRNLKRLIERACGAEDLADFESLVDWDADYWQNKETLLDYLKPETNKSQWGQAYSKYEEMALEYYSEDDSQEPEVEIAVVPQVIHEPVQVTHRHAWYRRVYLPTASGEWLPVYVSGPSKNVITIPVAA